MNIWIYYIYFKLNLFNNKLFIQINHIFDPDLIRLLIDFKYYMMKKNWVIIFLL